MIKINLIPVKEKGKKKVGIKKDWVVLILSMVILFVILFFLQWRINREIGDTTAKISDTKKEIVHFKALTADVNKAKEDQKTLQDKLNIINTLRKEKASPVRVLDEVSIQKPEKLHLESLKKEGSKVGIEGIALDDETIANFMTNLRKSKLFKNVDLIVSEQSELSKIKIKKFTLSCEITLM
jgi:type IV pilus assembly protein PilN